MFLLLMAATSSTWLGIPVILVDTFLDALDALPVSIDIGLAYVALSAVFRPTRATGA